MSKKWRIFLICLIVTVLTIVAFIIYGLFLMSIDDFGKLN
ncbi:hypothetical protein DEU42_102177 [Flavobacterium sp. AG291]|nr:hypothetical protein DEU42_102177 [Flavobacterium sp. AG291]